MRKLAIVLGLAGLLLGCEDPDEPYLEITGGGFVFNYRLAEAHYLLLAAAKRTLPEGGSIEAAFEDPAGGPAIVLRLPVGAERRLYRFETRPIEGVTAGRDYAVRISVLGADGKLLAAYDKPFHASLDQSVLPRGPLTQGPGYAPPAGGPAN